MTDISSPLEFFINSMLTIFNDVFNILSDISFFGFSLLSYTIALFVLSISIPLIIAIVRGRVRGFRSISSRNARSSYSDED